MSRPAASPSRRDVTLFFAAALFFCTANLGGTTLAPLDDCFYAVKAREMAAHPGMTVTWAGRPAFQNPPGQIWVLAGSMRVFGAGDFAARLPGALMTLGVLAGTAWIGAELLSPLAGLTGAALLAVSPLFLNNARRVMLEMPSLFWMVLAMGALVAWRRRPAAVFLFAPALAMAMLTKSVLGVTPLVVAVATIAWRREWRPLLRDPRFGIAVAAGLALGASWWIDQSRRFGGEFLGIHFGREIAGRSLAATSALRRIFGYPAILLTQFEPVVLLAVPGALVAARQVRADSSGTRRTALLFDWASVPVMVALAPAAQSAHYVFAIFPALALLAAAGLAGWAPRFARVFALRVVPALLVAGGAVFWIAPQLLTRDTNRAFRDASPAIASRVPAGTEVAFLGNDYWRLANPLLWYDDRVLAPSAESGTEAALRALTSGGLLLVQPGRLGDLPAAAASARRVLETRDAVLLDLVPPR